MKWILIPMLVLAGCATTPQAAPPKEVLIPVVKPCITNAVPPAPAGYADDDLAATPDPVERLKKVGAANQQRRARLSVLEPAVAACR